MGKVRPQPGCYDKSMANENLVTRSKVHDGQTARDLAKEDHFIKACESRGVTPSVRQARDYRRKLGHFAK